MYFFWRSGYTVANPEVAMCYLHVKSKGVEDIRAACRGEDS